MVLWAVLAVIAAYLIGSVNFAVIFANAFLKKDVRKLGSGNAGTTNVMRTAGFLPGALTFVCDALKGFAASFGGKMVFELIAENTSEEWAVPVYGAYLCGLACLFGHVFPVFFQFKGGKGVATSVGVYAVCSPIAIAVGLAVFAVTVLVSKMVSLGSVFAAVTVVVLSILLHSGGPELIPAVLSIAMGVLVIVKHKDNIKRLIAGTESKITERRH